MADRDLSRSRIMASYILKGITARTVLNIDRKNRNFLMTEIFY